MIPAGTIPYPPSNLPFTVYGQVLYQIEVVIFAKLQPISFVNNDQMRQNILLTSTVAFPVDLTMI